MNYDIYVQEDQHSISFLSDDIFSKFTYQISGQEHSLANVSVSENKLTIQNLTDQTMLQVYDGSKIVYQFTFKKLDKTPLNHLSLNQLIFNDGEIDVEYLNFPETSFQFNSNGQMTNQNNNGDYHYLNSSFRFKINFNPDNFNKLYHLERVKIRVPHAIDLFSIRPILTDENLEVNAYYQLFHNSSDAPPIGQEIPFLQSQRLLSGVKILPMKQNADYNDYFKQQMLLEIKSKDGTEAKYYLIDLEKEATTDPNDPTLHIPHAYQVDQGRPTEKGKLVSQNEYEPEFIRLVSQHNEDWNHLFARPTQVGSIIRFYKENNESSIIYKKIETARPSTLIGLQIAQLINGQTESIIAEVTSPNGLYKKKYIYQFYRDELPFTYTKDISIYPVFRFERDSYTSRDTYALNEFSEREKSAVGTLLVQSELLSQPLLVRLDGSETEAYLIIRKVVSALKNSHPYYNSNVVTHEPFDTLNYFTLQSEIESPLEEQQRELSKLTFTFMPD